MVHQGRIEEWNDARGFGFIQPLSGGERVFVHISACRLRGRRPDEGLIVSYRTRTDERGRPTACDVQLASQQASRKQGPVARGQGKARKQGRHTLQRFRLALGLGALGFLLTALHLQWLPFWLCAGMLGLSAASFIQYAWDKSQARTGGWRTAESTLQLTALAGGWPGALLAQALLHHKNAKPGFQLTFWACIVLNVMAVTGQQII